MILEVGQFGITQMKNTHSSHKRDMIMICKDMDITGIISVTNNVINLGYNEDITLETKEQAKILFKIIQGIIVKGIEAENVIENMMDAMKTIFFQDQIANTTI
jgi:hypothetical protein